MGMPNGTTITFGTSSFTANIHRIGGTTLARGAVPDTHLGTTAQKTYIFESLVEPGQFEIEFEWDQSFSTFPPISAAAETITVTFPLKTGEGTAATLAGTGGLIEAEGPTLEDGALMTGRAVVKWDGKTDATYTAGSA